MKLIALLCLLFSATALAQSGIYGPQDCEVSSQKEAEIADSKQGLKIVNFSGLCKTRPNGEIIDLNRTCVVEKGQDSRDLGACMISKGVFSTTVGGLASPRYTEFYQKMKAQKDPGPVQVGGFYNSKDCEVGALTISQIERGGENHTLYSYKSLCASKPDGRVIETTSECIGKRSRTPSLEECMEEKVPSLKNHSGGVSMTPRLRQFALERTKPLEPKMDPQVCEGCQKSLDGKSLICPDGVYKKSEAVLDGSRVSGKELPIEEGLKAVKQITTGKQ